MIISHKYKLIFIHIYKTAGTFVTKVLKNLDEDTGKAEKARKLNVNIITVEEFTINYL